MQKQFSKEIAIITKIEYFITKAFNLRLMYLCYNRKCKKVNVISKDNVDIVIMFS